MKQKSAALSTHRSAGLGSSFGTHEPALTARTDSTFQVRSCKGPALSLTIFWSLLLLSSLVIPHPQGSQLTMLFYGATAVTGVLAVVRFFYLLRLDERQRSTLRAETAELAARYSAATASVLSRLHAVERYWCDHPGSVDFEALERLNTARVVSQQLERKGELIKLLTEIGTMENLLRARALLVEPLLVDQLSAQLAPLEPARTALGRSLDALLTKLELEFRQLHSAGYEERLEHGHARTGQDEDERAAGFRPAAH